MSGFIQDIKIVIRINIIFGRDEQSSELFRINQIKSQSYNSALQYIKTTIAHHELKRPFESLQF